MKKIPRCEKCVKKYSESSQEYHLPLQQMWIRNRLGNKIVWKVVGYYCRVCKKLYTLDVEKGCKKHKPKRSK